MINLVILEDRSWANESGIELYVGEHTLDEIRFIEEKLKNDSFYELLGDYDNRNCLELRNSFITVMGLIGSDTKESNKEIAYVIELVNDEAREQTK